MRCGSWRATWSAWSRKTSWRASTSPPPRPHSTEQAGGGLASVLAHAIGHRAHVSNGIVNAIVLPHTMRFNSPATEHTTARISESLQRAPTGTAPEVLEALLARLPIAHRLREIGIAEADLDAIAQAAMGDFFISRAPRKVQGASDLRGILAAAW